MIRITERNQSTLIADHRLRAYSIGKPPFVFVAVRVDDGPEVLVDVSFQTCPGKPLVIEWASEGDLGQGEVVVGEAEVAA